MPDMVTPTTPLITLEDRVEVTAADPSWMILVTNPAIDKAIRRAFKMKVSNLLSQIATYVLTALGTKQLQQIRTTTAADGTLTWTYPTAYPAGVVPVLSMCAEAPAGSNDSFTVETDGPATNTMCKIKVVRSQRSTISILNVLTAVVVPVTTPGATVVHLTARMPTTT